MALRVAFKVVWLDINDAPFIHIAWRNVAGGN
jgi:hypothetical protein